MKFQKTVLASLIFVATTAAWAQTGGASQPASQPASNPNENLPDRAVTWPELDKVLNGDPNSTDEAQKLGVWGAVVKGFGDIDKEVSDLKKNTFKAFQELVVAANNDNDAQDQEIAKKADKVVVDELIEKHNAAGKEIERFVEHVNKANEALEEHIKLTNNNLTAAIATRVSKAKYEADQTELKENLKELADGLAEHLPTFATKEEVNKKASIESVTNLATVLDKTVEVANQHSGAITDLAEDFGTFKSQVETEGTKVADALETLRVRSNEHSEALEELDQHIKDTNTNLTHAIHTRVSKAKYAADKAATEAVLEAKADKAEVQVVDDKVNTLATNAQTAVDTLAQATRDLAIATDRELTGLKDKNTEMSGKLEATEVRVTNVEAAVRNLGTTQISALDARITANSDRINGLNTRVNQLSKELKRGMASQAALSGLFQPYTVGKVNITAAVGGYKSATAVAIGAGYRVNNKFAAKAGVAFSAGSPAYNVGINYEF